MTRFAYLATAMLAAVCTPALAGDFDGSRPLICAPVEAHECAVGDPCDRALPEDVGAPAFMRIEFARRAIVGPKRSSEIMHMDRSESQLLLMGKEAGFGWTIVLEQASGRMTVTLASHQGAFVLFGSCTPG